MTFVFKYAEAFNQAFIIEVEFHCANYLTLDVSMHVLFHHQALHRRRCFYSVVTMGNQSTRHTVKSCDELTVVSDGVVAS